jgi:GH35 family endo-1,4-beta-xylanase
VDSKYQCRKAGITVRLMNVDGSPAANKAAVFNQTSHQFLFGVGGFDAVELAGGKADWAGAAEPDEAENVRRQEKLGKLFGFHNYATLPFYLGRYEPEEGKPDERRLKAAASWFKDRGIATKGHPLCWHTVCSPWLMNYSNKEIMQKVTARIERDVSAFAGLIDRWDVINEVVIMPIFDKYDNAITRVCKELGRVRMIKEVFHAARSANPQAILMLNDFNVSIDYEILIDGCLQAGAPIDVIGIQSHQHQGYWGKEKLREVLDRFSHFGLPLHFTENTLISGEIMPPHIADLNDWQVEEWPSTPEGEERQAAEIIEMYEILFAHPQVEAITTWSGSDNAWLHAPAGFLRIDNSEKPSYQALKAKVESEWRTNATIRSDANGFVSLEGFKGGYQVSCGGKTAGFELDGKKKTAELTLK